MTKKLSLLFAFFFLSMILSVFGGTIRLMNDSAYKLKVIIRAADGTYLGEMILSAQHSAVWTDWGNLNMGGLGDQSKYSQTPYSVSWFCLGGSDFSVCDQVTTGATCTAHTCAGTRSCPAPKPKPGARPNQPETLIPSPQDDIEPSTQDSDY